MRSKPAEHRGAGRVLVLGMPPEIFRGCVLNVDGPAVPASGESAT